MSSHIKQTGILSHQFTLSPEPGVLLKVKLIIGDGVGSG